MNAAWIESKPCGADVTVIACPQCGRLAQVTWSTSDEGTPDAIEQMTIRCQAGHQTTAGTFHTPALSSAR